MTNETILINILDIQQISKLSSMRKQDQGLINFILEWSKGKKEQLKSLMKSKEYHEEELLRLKTILKNNKEKDYTETVKKIHDYELSLESISNTIVSMKNNK